MSHPTESPKSERRPARLIGLALLGAILALLGGYALWPPSDDQVPSRPGGPGTDTTTEDDADDAPDRESRTPALQNIASGVEDGVLRGRIVDHRGAGIADQPYWIEWGRASIDERSAAPDETIVPTLTDRTDDLGRFAIPLEDAGIGLLWFRAPAGLRAGCAINPDTLTARDWSDVRLPPTAMMTIRGVGLRPNARFRVRIHPAIRIGGGWSASDSEVWPSRYWRRSQHEVDYIVHHSFVTEEVRGTAVQVELLHQRPHELDVQGTDFRVLDEPSGHRVASAPDEVTFRVGPATPSGMVVVRGSVGSAPTSMAGRVITTPADPLGRWRERDQLVDGRCRLDHDRLRPGDDVVVSVIVASGEFFERTLEVRGTGRQETITFILGEGIPPTIFPIELDLRREPPLVFSELATGPLIRGTPWSEYDLSNRDYSFGYCLRKNGILAIKLPSHHTRLHVFQRDGRVARGRGEGGWLPGKRLPPIRLETAYQQHGYRKKATAEFELDVVTERGRRKWITLDRFLMGPETKWFPVWQKFAPQGMKFRFSFAVEREDPIELQPGK